MPALVPISSTQHVIATAAQSAVRRIDQAVASSSEDGRAWARTHGGTESPHRRQAQNILSAERNEHSARGPRRMRGLEDKGYWPSAAYFVQHLSQEAMPDESPTAEHGAGIAKYPSLAFDSDIFLPGETIAPRNHAEKRVDIVV